LVGDINLRHILSYDIAVMMSSTNDAPAIMPEKNVIKTYSSASLIAFDSIANAL
jgi:hypothetical protein